MLDDHICNLIDLIPKDRSSFDIQRLFFLLTLDSATHFLFGESVGCMLPPSGKTGMLEKSAVGSAQGFANAFGMAQDYLSARVRAQGMYWVINPKEFREANRQVHEVVDHYVNLALKSKHNPEKKSIDGRYIFLEAVAADTDDPKVLRDNLLNILLAGRDTTASLLSSTFFYLSRHPKVWNRLRREIVEIFGDAKNPRSEITQTKLKDIHYLRYVLNEGESLQCIVYTLSMDIQLTPTQSFVSSLLCLSTSALQPKIPPYRSVVARTTNPRFMSRRARWLPTASTLCTAGRIYGGRMRLPSGPSAGRKMLSMDGNTCLSMVGRVSVLVVSCCTFLFFSREMKLRTPRMTS